MLTPASAGRSPGPPTRARSRGLESPEARIVASLDEAANTAFARLGRYESTIVVAGHRIRLIFAGEELQTQSMRPFAHIETSSEAPAEIEIYVWDTVQSGVAMSAELGARLHSLLAEAHRDGGPLLSVLDQGVFFYNPATSRAYHWLPDAANLDETNKASPVRLALSYAMAYRGLHAMHAAALKGASGGLLLCGSSGVGKSTTSVACARAGFEFAADDFCFVEVDRGRARAYSLYVSAKLFGHRLSDLPQFAALVTNPNDLQTEKAISFLDEGTAFKVIPQVEITAVVVLASKGNSSASFQRISPVQALVGLAPSTVILFRSRSQHLSALKALVANVPCFEMHLASDLDANPPAIESLLESLRAERE
jgi:hypothetical protein